MDPILLYLNDQTHRQKLLDAIRNEGEPGTVVPVQDELREHLTLRLPAVGEFKAAGDEPGDVDQVTISTSSEDRDGDRIFQTPNKDGQGWILEDYLKNPIVAWAHDTGAPPIAKATAVKPTKAKTTARIAWWAGEFATEIRDMYALGFMNAWSVGFSPSKFATRYEDERFKGFDFFEQELLEFSAVPVPANPEALSLAARKGLFPHHVEQQTGFVQSLDDLARYNADSALALPIRRNLPADEAVDIRAEIIDSVKEVRAGIRAQEALRILRELRS